jgi:hypothetical protein
MANYRISRNIEKSLLDFITYQLAHATPVWTGIRVEKGFSKDYKEKIPMIGVEALEIRPQKKEIGSKTNIKYYTVKIRIFASDDGQRLDLSDWLFDLLEDDINYNTYIITNNVATGTLAGRIVITKWFRNSKELQNTENLESEDRCRHIFEFEAIVALS